MKGGISRSLSKKRMEQSFAREEIELDTIGLVRMAVVLSFLSEYTKRNADSRS